MTSNVGAKMIQKRAHLGFHQNSEELQYQKMKERVTGELKRVFNPEFLNRVDETITFHELSVEHIQEIVDIMMREINQQIQDKELTILLNDDVRRWLAEKGHDPVYGARPLRRLIQRSIEDMLAEEILNGTLSGEQLVQIILEDDDTLGYTVVREEEPMLHELSFS
jgi:ATP-dependent Clp protease ATP-binding subunit ClpC